MTTWLVVYLAIGFVLAEGAAWSVREERTFDIKPYAAIVFLWPLLIVAALLSLRF